MNNPGRRWLKPDAVHLASLTEVALCAPENEWILDFTFADWLLLDVLKKVALESLKANRWTGHMESIHTLVWILHVSWENWIELNQTRQFNLRLW